MRYADPDDGIYPALALVPAGDIQIDDVWHTDGMRATGSNDVVITDVFVPGHRLVRVSDIYTGTAPGAGFTTPAPTAGRWCPPFPCWRRCLRSAAPNAPLTSTPSDCPSECWRTRASCRRTSRSRRPTSPRPRVRLRALRGLLADTVGEIETSLPQAIPCHGRCAPRPGWRRRTSCTSRAAVIGDLLEASGASAHFLDNPLQRIKRDVDVICGHVVFDYDTSRELAAALTLGMKVPRTAMV